ncbi:MAG: efflux transporter outer membrane subunit [Phycisphaerae bacterium]|nr:efflux transporter outer membrane subunit [Phycisphaerae bacterium]
MNKVRFGCLLSAAILSSLAGCNLTPDYTKPDAPVSANWPTGTAYKNAAPDAPIASEIPWRQFFADPRLQQLIEMALNNNRDLRIAALNVEQMRAIYGIQRAELLPTLDAVGSAGHQRIAADLSTTGKPMRVEQYSVNLGILAWEIDFFGRIRSLKEKALEEYLSSEQARRSAQILLITEVANAFLALAADRDGLQLTQSTLQSQKATYDLIQNLCQKGASSELDLFRAQSRVDAARVDAGLYERLVAQDENALSFLVGAVVPDDLLPASLSEVAPSMEISPGVSSEVLLNRPDILQAEHILKAANANIGAARAAFFPRIALTSTIGTASDELSGLFKSGSNTWNFAPQAVLPVFDARLGPALEATKAQQKILQAQYEQSIQRAFKEVADALAVQGTVEEQIVAQQSFVHAVAETYRLSNVRYIGGIESFLSVIDAQRSLYAAEQRLIALRQTRLANQVVLYAALGGGCDLADSTEP